MYLYVCVSKSERKREEGWDGVVCLGRLGLGWAVLMGIKASVYVHF